MPSVKEHATMSENRTGKTYEELHEWMDPWKKDEKLAIHRHDIVKIPENIMYVEKKWGEEGKREFLHHLKEDYEKRSLILTILQFIKRKIWGG